MSHYFFDSSAYVKLFIQEAGSDPVISLIQSVSVNSRFFSALARVEVCSAIFRKLRLNEITSASADVALDAFVLDSMGANELPVTSTIIASASELPSRLAIRTLDAIQLATALNLKDRLPGHLLTFVCADAELTRAARNQGLSVFNPLENTEILSSPQPT